MVFLWTTPPAALITFTGVQIYKHLNPPPAAVPVSLKVPIEVINRDEKPRIIYVDLETQAIPEPSTLLLLPATGLLLFLRRR